MQLAGVVETDDVVPPLPVLVGQLVAALRHKTFGRIIIGINDSHTPSVRPATAARNLRYRTCGRYEVDGLVEATLLDLMPMDDLEMLVVLNLGTAFGITCVFR